MKYPLLVRRAMLLAASCALLQQGSVALAAQGEESEPKVGTRPAINTLTPQPVAAALSSAVGASSASANDAQGNVTELMRMVREASQGIAHDV